jgi:hypothetical protein
MASSYSPGNPWRSHSDYNIMNHQNFAVGFLPVDDLFDDADAPYVLRRSHIEDFTDFDIRESDSEMYTSCFQSNLASVSCAR